MAPRGHLSARPRGLPARLGLEADSSLRRLDGGCLLAGGSPLRILRLSANGASRLDAWLAGEPVGAAEADRALARRLLDAAMVHPRPGSCLPDASEAVALDDVTGRPGSCLSDASEAVALDDVTAVIPVRDDPAGLTELLAALDGSIPAVVVDDASADAEAIAEVAARFGARLVARPVNGGPGAARNTGLDQVTSPIVLFADADAVVDPPAVRTLLAHFADPAVIAAAPRVKSLPGPGLLAAYEGEHSPLDMGGAPSPVGPQRRVRYVPAAVLLVRTEAARGAGGFDESLRWGEDVDFLWRLATEAATVRYEPAAVAWHRPRADWRAWIEQRRRYGASAAALAERHGAAVAPARCSRSAVAAWAALAMGHPLAGAALAVTSAARLAARLEGVADGRPLERLALAGRLTLKGHGTAGAGLARAVTRAWLPVALGGAAASRRLRPALATAVLAPALVEWCRGRRPAGPVATVGLRLADDAAYCAGVWEGMARRRSLEPIRPALVAGAPRN